MAEYKLTKKAVEDLVKIWDYTFEVWSKNQAPASTIPSIIPTREKKTPANQI